MSFPRYLSILLIASSVCLTGNEAAAASASSSGSICDTQSVPAMPITAVMQADHDTVQVRALVQGGSIRQVELVHGPRIYLGAIRTAMQQYRCRVQSADVWVNQEFVFLAPRH